MVSVADAFAPIHLPGLPDATGSRPVEYTVYYISLHPAYIRLLNGIP